MPGGFEGWKLCGALDRGGQQASDRPGEAEGFG